MKKIPLTKGKYALVDDIDYEHLSQWKWYYLSSGYAVRDQHINKKKFNFLMHRVIMNTPKNMDTDHINHNPLDNRRKNLRIVTTSQNLFNTSIRSDNTSGYKGVSWSKSAKKWWALIWKDKKHHSLGYYDNLEDAISARKSGEKLYFGSFVPFIK